jgi:hypothetical protein
MVGSSGAGVGDTGWIGFVGGGGSWTQISANNLVAPPSATNALITLYGTDGLGANVVWTDLASLRGTSATNLEFDLLATNRCGFYRVVEPR